MSDPCPPIHVIGGGLAGSEAAWQIARQNVPVVIHEMRPVRQTPAHRTGGLAELVCSNSFRADDPQTSAIGILHREMRCLNSLILAAADAHKLPAGGALAVDRGQFSAAVTAAVCGHALVTVVREEINGVPPLSWDSVIVATGPLTSPSLAAAIGALTGERDLAFFDAIAPVVHWESIDMEKAWFQSRYDKAGPAGTGADYVNCPLTQDQYFAFVDALIDADRAGPHTLAEEDAPYFNGCLPVEIMAERGRETLRHGPMKPFGLTNPHSGGAKPYAVVQLRQDNALGTLYNMVGFQTKLKYHAQVEIFRTIPGLENASFARTRRDPPQHLSELAQIARWRLAAQGRSEAAVRGPDYRLRRLCRKRCDRASRGPHGGGGANRRGLRAVPADDRTRRSHQPYHRRTHRDHRRRVAFVSADEY